MTINGYKLEKLIHQTIIEFIQKIKKDYNCSPWLRTGLSRRRNLSEIIEMGFIVDEVDECILLKSALEKTGLRVEVIETVDPNYYAGNMFYIEAVKPYLKIYPSKDGVSCKFMDLETREVGDEELLNDRLILQSPVAPPLSRKLLWRCVLNNSDGLLNLHYNIIENGLGGPKQFKITQLDPYLGFKTLPASPQLLNILRNLGYSFAGLLCPPDIHVYKLTD